MGFDELLKSVENSKVCVYTSEAEAGVFTKRLVSLMKMVMHKQRVEALIERKIPYKLVRPGGAMCGVCQGELEDDSPTCPHCNVVFLCVANEPAQ